MYELGPEGRAQLGKKAQDYAFSEFALNDTIDKWDKTLTELTNNWKSRYERWNVTEI